MTSTAKTKNALQPNFEVDYVIVYRFAETGKSFTRRIGWFSRSQSLIIAPQRRKRPLQALRSSSGLWPTWAWQPKRVMAIIAPSYSS